MFDLAQDLTAAMGASSPGQLRLAAHGTSGRLCRDDGDSVHDLEAARVAGMLRVAVLTGPATAEDLAPCRSGLADIGHLAALA